MARAVIEFYSVNAEYGELSNFAPYPIKLRGKLWPTSEHFFQAQKFENRADQDEIRKVSSPMIAARMGRDRKRKLRRDWERVKVGIMREAVEAKFRQHASSASCCSRRATPSSSSTPRTMTTGATAVTAAGATSSAAS